jgi:hypothetical protein
MVESSAKEVEHPKFIVREVEAEMYRQAERYTAERRRIQYQLYVGTGMCMPFKNADYQVKIRIAEHEITSEKNTKLKTGETNYCRWSQMIPDYKMRDAKLKERSEA